MSARLHFGRILSNHRYLTSEGDYFLSSASAAATLDEARRTPFPEAREREGQFVVLRARVRNDVMLDCSLVEAVPPIASSVFGRLVDENRGIREHVLQIAREVRNELVGEPEPVPLKAIPLEIQASGPLPLCVIDIGHHPDAPGAAGALDGRRIHEFAFNKGLADLIASRVRQARIVIIHRDTGDVSGLKRLAARTNALDPDFVISLHANSSAPMSDGSEVLYYHASTEGRRLAVILQREFLAKLGLRDRGIRPRTSSGRGGCQLVMTRAPMVIGEPFFIGNPSEFAKVAAGKDGLAQAYADAIDEYAAGLSNPPPTRTAVRPVASHLAPGSTFLFETEGLTKERFLARNRSALEDLIGLINHKLIAVYGSGFRPLTREDVWVTTYVEAGLRRGKVDPDHRHSGGERGLLPLAKNIRDWNGDRAPVWNRPMPVARNLEHFYLYLGHLKNKPVGGPPRHLYRGLFQTDKICGDPVREAKVLAGVVHGYFYSGTYRDRKVPFDHLIRGYQNGVPLVRLMKGTAYIHAGTSIITGREKNIEVALGLIDEAASGPT